MKAKIAIIGASFGQLELCKTAKRMGLTVICFAWPQGAVCKSLVDKYYPISILEKEQIVRICRSEGVTGVVSNASDLTAEIVAYVSEQLGLVGNPYNTILNIRDKGWVRKQTNSIPGLSPIEYAFYQGYAPKRFPCIIKPNSGSSKKGVSFVYDANELKASLDYCQLFDDSILIEEFVYGKEYSIETLSYRGKHYVIQITDKITTGPPHFVELEHHQPAQLKKTTKKKLIALIPLILDRVGFKNGASHIEIKVDELGHIYLIEINPRGGGDHISDRLVRLSTGFDYVEAMIQVSLGAFVHRRVSSRSCSGVFFLCQQTERLLPFFEEKEHYPWIMDCSYSKSVLLPAVGNTDRNGFLIYKNHSRLTL